MKMNVFRRKLSLRKERGRNTFSGINSPSGDEESSMPTFSKLIKAAGC
jgi:hypothetical protein